MSSSNEWSIRVKPLAARELPFAEAFKKMIADYMYIIGLGLYSILRLSTAAEEQDCLQIL
jgi:hypothetical protein